MNRSRALCRLCGHGVSRARPCLVSQVSGFRSAACHPDAGYVDPAKVVPRRSRTLTTGGAQTLKVAEQAPSNVAASAVSGNAEATKKTGGGGGVVAGVLLVTAAAAGGGTWFWFNQTPSPSATKTRTDMNLVAGSSSPVLPVHSTSPVPPPPPPPPPPASSSPPQAATTKPAIPLSPRDDLLGRQAEMKAMLESLRKKEKEEKKKGDPIVDMQKAEIKDDLKIVAKLLKQLEKSG